MERKQESPEVPKRPSPPGRPRADGAPPSPLKRKSGTHVGKIRKKKNSAGNPFVAKQKQKRRFEPATELSALTYRAIRRVSHDSKERTTFLLTYPVYGSALELADEVQAIFDFYNRLGSNSVQEQVASLLQQWVHSEHRTMSASRSLCDRILSLTRHVIPDTRLEHVRLSIEYELSQGKKRSYPSVILYNVDLAACQTDSAIVTMQPILQYPPAALAEHLTMVDWRHFRHINNSEFFNHAWQGPHKKEKAPHLCALVERFDQVSFWGATRVLTAGSSSKQAATIESLLAIIELVSALNQVSVQRLKAAWKKVSASYIDRFNYYDELFSPSHGHDMYRKALVAAQETGDPVFPISRVQRTDKFTAVLLGDMVHIEDGNPAHVEKNNGQKINMQRLDILGEQLLLVKNFQKKSYRFQTDNKVIFYLANLQGLGDEDLYQFSLKLQPTEAQLEEQREKKEREKEQGAASKRLNSPRRSIVGALSAISPRAWAREKDSHHSDYEVEDSAIESDAGSKRRDVTAKKKFLPLFRNKSSQHIKEDSWIEDVPHHEEERDTKDEDEEAECERRPYRPPVPPRGPLSKSSGWMSAMKLPDTSSKSEVWKGGKNMEEAPPGYNKPRGLFLIGAGGRRRVGAPAPRLRRTSSVDSLPVLPPRWVAKDAGPATAPSSPRRAISPRSPRAKPPPPADWILGGGYSPRSDESMSPKERKGDDSGKKGTFALFRNLSSVISRPADDWELSIAEEKERAASYRKEQRGKASAEAKKTRELKRLKKKERRKMKKHLREVSAPSREPSSERSLSARSRSSSNASEGTDGKGKGGIEKLLRRAVSFVNGANMTEEEMIVRDTGPESLFTPERDIVRADSERVPLSEWYQGDGVELDLTDDERPKKKGLTRHNSLSRVRNFLKK